MPGNKGERGFPGNDGPKGYQGLKGNQGPRGLVGQTGEEKHSFFQALDLYFIVILFDIFIDS